MPESSSGATPQRLPDYYEQLQVSPRASLEVIHAAYRALARAHHPDVDRTPGAARRMQELNIAYATLCDPKRREAYDTRRERLRRRASASAAARTAEPGEVRVFPRVVPPVAGVPARAATGGAGLPLGRLLVIGAFVVGVLSLTMLGVWAFGALEDDTPVLTTIESAVDGDSDVPPPPILIDRRSFGRAGDAPAPVLDVRGRRP